MAKKSDKDKSNPKVHPELDGLNIEVDSFGKIKTNYDIDKINKFLNKHTDDKKLRDRDDLKQDEE